MTPKTDNFTSLHSLLTTILTVKSNYNRQKVKNRNMEMPKTHSRKPKPVDIIWILIVAIKKETKCKRLWNSLLTWNLKDQQHFPSYFETCSCERNPRLRIQRKTHCNKFHWIRETNFINTSHLSWKKHIGDETSINFRLMLD